MDDLEININLWHFIGLNKLNSLYLLRIHFRGPGFTFRTERDIISWSCIPVTCLHPIGKCWMGRKAGAAVFATTILDTTDDLLWKSHDFLRVFAMMWCSEGCSTAPQWDLTRKMGLSILRFGFSVLLKTRLFGHHYPLGKLAHQALNIVNCSLLVN